MFNFFKNKIYEIYIQITYKINKQRFENDYNEYLVKNILNKIDKLKSANQIISKNNHFLNLNFFLIKKEYYFALKYYLENKKKISPKNINNLFVLLEIFLSTKEFKLAEKTCLDILKMDKNNKKLFSYIYHVFDSNKLKKPLKNIFSLTRHNNLLWPYGVDKNFVEKQDKAIKNDKKFIFINALPKSGSTFISRVLSQNYNFPKINIGLSFFPEEIIIENYLALSKRGGCICLQHINASADNIRLLKKFNITKFIIHIRDPRQSLLSWTFMIDELFNKGQINSFLSLSKPSLPDNYFSMNFNDKVLWQSLNYYKNFENWILNWLKYKNLFGIKFTFYEQLREDPNEFFKSLFKFYQIKYSYLKYPKLNKSINFRKGSTNEWTSYDPLIKIKINPKIKKLFYNV